MTLMKNKKFKRIVVWTALVTMVGSSVAGIIAQLVQYLS